MAHYKNIIRDHDNHDAEFGDKRVFVLDEREKFDILSSDKSGRTITINGPKILVVGVGDVTQENVTQHKLRSSEFWNWLASNWKVKAKRRKQAEKVEPQVGTTPTPAQRETMQVEPEPGVDDAQDMGRFEVRDGKW
jgi:hypothetical protein